MKKTVNRLLGKFGYRIVKKETTHSLTSMLTRIASRAPLGIQTVIDVGASDGRWSKQVMPFYPNANYLLIEANTVHQAGITAFASARPNVQTVMAVAGDKQGEIFFDASDPFGGVASHTHKMGYISLPVITIDDEIATRNLPAPYLLKLDTHGFELPILAGATVMLKQANMLIIESYNFTLHEGALRFHELCAYLENRGFRPVDFCEPLYRNDEVFWQFDLCFIRKDRPEFDHNNYQV